MNAVNPRDHRHHDRELVVRYATGDDALRPSQASDARSLIRDCPDCAGLASDVVSISEATAALLPVGAPRDFLLTPERAAALRGSALRQLLDRLAGAGGTALQPLAAAALAIGLLLVAIGGIQGMLPAGSGTEQSGVAANGSPTHQDFAASTAAPTQGAVAPVAAPAGSAPAPVAGGPGRGTVTPAATLQAPKSGTAEATMSNDMAAASPVPAPTAAAMGPSSPASGAPIPPPPGPPTRTSQHPGKGPGATAAPASNASAVAPPPPPPAAGATAPATHQGTAPSAAPSAPPLGVGAVGTARPTAIPPAPAPGQQVPAGPESQVPVMLIAGAVLALAGLALLILVAYARRATKDPLLR